MLVSPPPPSFLDTYSLSTSSLGCNALWMFINFLVLWSICLSSSLVHYRNSYFKLYVKFLALRISLTIYEVPSISFQTFFVWALLLIVHTWNSSPLPNNLLRLQCTCCTVPTTSRRPHGSRLVWVCQWPSSQPLSFPQLSHNNSL